MATGVSTAVVRVVTVGLAVAPLLLLYRAGWLTVDDVSADQVWAWVHQPLTAGFLIMLGQVGAWLLWTLLAAAVADHGYRYLAARLRWRLDLRMPGPVQAVAAALLGTTAVTSAAVPVAAHDRTAADTDTSPKDPRSACEDTPGPGAHSQPAEAAPTASSEAATAPASSVAPPTHHSGSVGVTAPTSEALGMTVRVVPGDTLWDLSAEHLGDAHRWRDIYQLNRGQPQTNGSVLTDPDVIHVGWNLDLPAHQAAPAPQPAEPTRRAPVSQGPTSDAPDASPPAAVNPAASPTSTRETPEARPSASPRTGVPSAPGDPAGRTTPGRHAEPHQDQSDNEGAVALPARGWISLGLAAAVVSVAGLLRLQRRRHARLILSAPTSTAPPPPPPPLLATIGSRRLDTNDRVTHGVPAPVGVDTDADAVEVSLFHLPGPGIALHGPGALPAARAILAAVLTTNATGTAVLRPVVVTTIGLLTRLLPENAPAVGLDPDGTAYDGERLVILADTAAAITHAEEEMISRRRLLDTFDADTITGLNARTDHAETQPPYVLLIESTSRHAARLHAIAAHREALDLHPVILGPHDDIPAVEVTDDGTTTDTRYPLAKLSTLGADDLAAILTMLTDTLARPEAGTDVDDPPAEIPPAAAGAGETTEPVPAQPNDAAALVRLRVLGPITVTTTTAGPITTGMRSGSYTVLAVLAAHPAGRTLDQLTADLHPDVDPAAAVKRIRTDITSARRVLRAATGHDEPMFIVYDPATGRYHLDPQTVTVDLWQMLTAINQAISSDDDAMVLAALHRATELYAGDFAEGHDHPWAVDYATSYRHQILTAYTRIAEILEPDHPDHAVTALEHAVDLDPVNEELYQRIMRIHGRQQRPDAARRTLRRLEKHLTDLGDTEPTQATRRVAARQLRHAAPVPGERP
ncbi:BTAD domain-containing putative transcriptional regulator [Micromonospora sp. WMMD1082]|uniref:BTAD domain-containing putative transcriptional regulator n=1 Tax=Micromonospora sp. WMMD1082 TaxID=3016104 RepID=UPI002415CF55|nr:BTAD domain-containing putative transcriptional regulator [Micromonospora sp. WMMD1082]MDG4793498.1 BTAD domain-containing putative transcriptional regulator [Micromonospora sp. WMMD1082]